MISRTISHYEILDKIGEGGMGAVYRARRHGSPTLRPVFRNLMGLTEASGRRDDPPGVVDLERTDNIALDLKTNPRRGSSGRMEDVIPLMEEGAGGSVATLDCEQLISLLYYPASSTACGERGFRP